MAVFRDKKNGSRYVQFRYTDWKGQRQQKMKRGFSTKKEVQNWEREFLMKKQADVDMTFIVHSFLSKHAARHCVPVHVSFHKTTFAVHIHLQKLDVTLVP